jgi:hypothetical protein
MTLQPSDVLFIAIVIWIAVTIIDSDSGGGRKARVPVA